MEKSKPRLGASNFDEIIKKQIHVVDKTLFIKEFMEDDIAQVCAILRPRRFGKSTNLSMLKSFLSLGAQPSSFARFEIGKPEYQSIVEKHCGKYPVIYLDLKDIKGETWEKMSTQIVKLLQILLICHDKYLSERDPHKLKDLQNSSATIENFTFVLYLLTKTLSELHESQVIVLIDEYDAPLNEAYRKGYYEQAAEFFGSFYSNGLKNNGFLEKACLMGIVEIRGIGIFSSFNNVAICSVVREPYSSMFGFSKDEVRKFLKEENAINNANKSDAECEVDVENVVGWYNGYTIGNHVCVINPWSFMSWFRESKVFMKYWVDTSSLEAIVAIIKQCDPITFYELTSILTDDEPLRMKMINSSVNYSREWDLRSVTTFLIMTGYLSYKTIEDQPNMIQIQVPNEELRQHWEEEIYRMFKGHSEVNKKQAETREIFFSDPFDFERFEGYVENFFVEQNSYFDFNYEANYHICLFTFFRTLFYRSKDVIPKSNRESGHGRYDLMIELPNLNRVICIELKRSVNEESLEIDAETALTQIDKLVYFADYPGYECIKIGVSFCSKIMSKFHYAISNLRKKRAT